MVVMVQLLYSNTKAMRKHLDKCDKLFKNKHKVLMWDFLYLYAEISQITTDKQLLKKYPNIKKKIRLIIPKDDLVIRTNNELKNFAFSTMRNNSFVYSKYKTKTICFLRHLRNVIAHVNITSCNKKKDMYILKDVNDKGLCTFYGIVDKEIFNRLLKVFEE